MFLLISAIFLLEHARYDSWNYREKWSRFVFANQCDLCPDRFTVYFVLQDNEVIFMSTTDRLNMLKQDLKGKVLNTMIKVPRC